MHRMIPLVLLAVSCAPRPVEPPSRIEVATMAVNWTDEALALAIEASPQRDWEPAVRAVEAAAIAVRRREDVCEALPALQLVASTVRCEKCFDAIAAAKEALECPN